MVRFKRVQKQVMKTTKKNGGNEMNWTCFMSLKRMKLMANSTTILWECWYGCQGTKLKKTNFLCPSNKFLNSEFLLIPKTLICSLSK